MHRRARGCYFWSERSEETLAALGRRFDPRPRSRLATDGHVHQWILTAWSAQTLLQRKLTSARFGGVPRDCFSQAYPELSWSLLETMARANIALWLRHAGCRPDLAAVGVTAGPGLVGALVVGVALPGASAAIPFITWKATCWPTCLNARPGPPFVTWSQAAIPCWSMCVLGRLRRSGLHH